MEIANEPGITLANFTHSNSHALANWESLLVYCTTGPTPGLLTISVPWGLEA